MATYDKDNIVVGACKVGEVETEGAEIAALNADSEIGASTIILTGVSLAIKAGDVIEVKDTANSEFAIARADGEEDITITTVTLLQKLAHAYTTAATAKAYKTTRTLWGVSRDNGVRFTPDFDTLKIYSDQVRGPVKTLLRRVERTISVDFQETTPAIIGKLRGFSSSVIGTAPEQSLVVAYDDNNLPEIILMITGPHIKGGYFRYTCHVRIESSGEMVRGSGEEVVIPASFTELPNIDTNEYGVFAFSATEYS